MILILLKMNRHQSLRCESRVWLRYFLLSDGQGRLEILNPKSFLNFHKVAPADSSQRLFVHFMSRQILVFYIRMIQI